MDDGILRFWDLEKSFFFDFGILEDGLQIFCFEDCKVEGRSSAVLVEKSQC